MQKRYKTKFPVARIKKIMRLDEEVGKVAQATPILISKALELFMQSLIDETCEYARGRGAKKLNAAHLKRSIMEVDKFDFLRDIVENLPNPLESAAPESPSAGAGDVKGEDEPTPTKRGRGRGRPAKIEQ
ncbi:histone-fold-containing protein [Phlyctochytrium arcticum]|nr:histone-fold-containing protein [Phlyctochytrium arcticum]